MKRLLLALSGFALALIVHGQPAPVNPAPATQTQVNAGLDSIHYVTPFTLNGFLGGGGGGGFSNINVTGGSISNATGSSDQWTTTSLYGITSVYGDFVYVPSPIVAPSLIINVAQALNTLVVSNSTTGNPNETLTFSGTPSAAGQTFSVLIYNSDTVAHTLTVPNAFSFNKASMATTFTIQPSCYVRASWFWDGVNYYISGDPTNSAYRSISWTVDNGSSVLNTGQVHRLNSIPSASTLVGYEVFAYPSGSVAFDIYKAVAGTTPSVSVFGSSTFPHVTTGTQSGKQTMNTGDTIAVATGDVFDMNVTSATTSTNATVKLYYVPTL